MRDSINASPWNLLQHLERTIITSIDICCIAEVTCAIAEGPAVQAMMTCDTFGI